MHRFLDDNFYVVLKSKFHCFFEHLGGFYLCDSYGRAGVCGFYKNRPAEFLLNGFFRFGIIDVSAEISEPFNLGNARSFKNCMADVFIHADRRRKDFAANIGKTRNFEKSLHCSVLAVFSVKNRENNVDIEAFPAVFGFDHGAVDFSVRADICFFKVSGIGIPFMSTDFFDISGIEIPFAGFCDSDEHRFKFFPVDVFPYGGNGHAGNFVFA